MVYTVNDGSLIFFTTSVFDSPAGYRREATTLFRNPVRGAKRMRAGGSPLLVAGRLPTDGYDAADSTFLAKIIFRDLYNRSSAVDSSSAP